MYSQWCVKITLTLVELRAQDYNSNMQAYLPNPAVHPVDESSSTTMQHYQVRQNKVTPVKFFAVFSPTVCNFNFKLYKFIFWNVLHLTAKWNVILLKNDEVIDFLTSSQILFLSENFLLKMQNIGLNPKFLSTHP